MTTGYRYTLSQEDFNSLMQCNDPQDFNDVLVLSNHGITKAMYNTQVFSTLPFEWRLITQLVWFNVLVANGGLYYFFDSRLDWSRDIPILLEYLGLTEIAIPYNKIIIEAMDKNPEIWQKTQEDFYQYFDEAFTTIDDQAFINIYFGEQNLSQKLDQRLMYYIKNNINYFINIE